MNSILQAAYENIWVPIFGRILMFFSKWIEGEEAKKQPTYNLKKAKK